MAEAIIINH